MARGVQGGEEVVECAEGGGDGGGEVGAVGAGGVGGGCAEGDQFLGEWGEGAVEGVEGGAEVLSCWGGGGLGAGGIGHSEVASHSEFDVRKNDSLAEHRNGVK